jgi:hypothetical protein
MRPTVNLSSGGPGQRTVAAQLAAIGKVDVLVGIPQANASRPSEQVNNAELMYIHTNGSPIKHIPARPVIEPAIEANRPAIVRELEQALEAVFEQDPLQARAHLEAAGIVGRNAAIRWFTDPRNGWPPNAPSTIARKGSDRPLIDTGQLRRAITYVVTTK